MTDTLASAGIPPRPSESDLDVIEEAAKKISRAIAEWLGEPVGEAEMKDIILAVGESDAYKMARCLDRLGWEADARLVEIFESVDLGSIRKRFEIEWVKRNNLAPVISIGEKCAFTHRGVAHVGEVVEISPDGKYHVFCAALGHVKTGSPEYHAEMKEKSVATLGQILNWEHVEPWKE